jgi:hypothetical protein
MSLLDTASLIVTPNGYKEGKLYSVIPSDGSGDLSVTRATTATRVNSAGLVELVPYNLLQYSEQFNNGYWGTYQATIAANNITAPDGTLTADRMTQSGAGGATVYVLPFNYTNSVYTASCYFKAGTANEVLIELNVTGGNCTIYYNLSTQVISGFGTYTSANIESVGNGWYRCSVVSALVNGSGYIALGKIGNVGETIYLWGAQMVEGSAVKPYQKTETRLNIPRLDYSNGTCPSLLVEPQRTNLLTYSSSFDSSDWSKSSGTITANSTTAPDGTATADTFTGNGALSNHDFFEGFTGGANTTASIYVKKNTAQYVYISLNYQSSGVNWATGVYDLDNLTTATFQSGGVTNQVATITDEGNGWRRITLSVATANTTLFCMFGLSDSMSPTLGSRGRVENTSSQSFYAWGSQLEAGSYATSYIPTTSASVTRNADVISKTGISSLIGQTEGTLFFDVYAQLNTADEQDLSISDGTGNNRAIIRLTSSGTIRGIGVFGGNLEFNIGGSAYTTGTRYKIALAYKNNDVALYVNGTSQGTSSSTTISGTLSRFGFDVFTNGAQIICSPTNAGALWKTRLTNTQLAQLTTI